MDIVRATAFVGALLLAWVSMRPFIDLGNQDLKDLSTGNETLTYLAFGGVAALMRRTGDPGQYSGVLATLLSPGLSPVRRLDRHKRAVLSLDPATSIRRFALTICVVTVAAVTDAVAEIAKRAGAMVQHRGDLGCWRSAISGYCWRRTSRFIWRPTRRSPTSPATGVVRSATRTWQRP